MSLLIQLELPLESGPTPTETFDQMVKSNATRARVLGHCWQVENGHQRFADILPPSSEDFLEVLAALKCDPQIFGQQYRERIEDELARLYPETSAPIVELSPENSQEYSTTTSTTTWTYREQSAGEELAQNVHVTQMSRV